MIKTLRHAGIVVTDMEESLGFYRDLLGLRVVLDKELSGEFLDGLLGLRGVRMRAVMLQAPDGNRVELFQFRSHPKKRPENIAISDIGCSHVAFSVEDLDDTFDTLSRNGIKFNCAPRVSPDGYAKVTYCHDPDGTIIELAQILDSDREPYDK